MPWKSRSRRSGGRGNTSRAMSRLYETSGRQSASPPPLVPRISTLHGAASLLLHYAAPPWSGAAKKRRWAGNRARLVVTARGVHGRNRLEEGMRREGTVAVFSRIVCFGSIPVDAVPLFVSLTKSAGRRR